VAAIAKMTSATGMLARKIQRHDSVSISQPPRTGPAAAVSAEKADHRPIARLRTSVGNEALISARLPGMRSAPPRPCSARAAIRWPMVGANPHQSDANAKIATPEANTRTRPRRSPSAPPGRISAASISV
jgi:hypothetical protein